MPRAWSETIDSHRLAVHQAIVDTTAALVQDQGLRAVTMSQIAEETGIGRATLYKYFADVEEILVAWHERQVGAHLGRLAEVRDRSGPSEQLETVLATYAELSSHGGGETSSVLHRGQHLDHAREHLRGFFAELLQEAAGRGEVRDDVAADELAAYCLSALSAAAALPSKAARRRLVEITLAGLRPTR